MTAEKNAKGISRNSSVEIVKILAMFMIVMFHVIQTLCSENPYFGTEYVFDIDQVTTNIQTIILAWIYSIGNSGNVIFYICSAWFLLDNNRVNYRKIVHILTNVWVINVISLLVFKLGAWYQLPVRDVIKCIFPTIFELNWYITCYVIFYGIHTGLNIIIRNCTQKQLLTINIITLILYSGINSLNGGHFFVNKLVSFIIVYFIIAYMKIYMKDYCASIKKNIYALIVGLVGTLILILITNYIGLHYSVWTHELTRWRGDLSPCILLTAISMFNLAQRKSFVNNTINSISSITLLIYLIHENYLFRQYVRPNIWMLIYEKIGYEHIVVIDLIYGTCLFAISIFVAYLYKISIQKIADRVSNRLCILFYNLYEQGITFLLRLK